MSAEIIIIITLALLVVGQAIERFFFGRQMLAQVSDALKAAMSRNINEYMTAITPPSNEETKPDTDEVELDDASDEEFQTFIKAQLTK